MPSVNPSPFGPKPQFIDQTGSPDLSYKLFHYVAGSTSTKQNTYTDSTGNVANTNPILLNALGQTPNELWYTSGQLYKVVLAPSTDTDPPTNPIWTIDNLQGQNDSSGLANTDEWVLFAAAPTYVNATTFTLVGNQTDTFQVGRRVKSTNTAGTSYGTVTSSVFSSNTTVTLQNTSGVLDSGLSAVYYGILAPNNPSIPAIFNQSTTYAASSVIGAKGATVPSAATTSVFSAKDGNVVDISGSATITSFGTAPQAGYVVEGTFTGTPTLVQSANLNMNLGNNAVFTGTTSGTTTLTVTAVASGQISIGDQITGTGITSGGVVTAFLTGTGGNGTYTVTATQNVGPITMTAVKNYTASVGDKYRAVANTTTQIDVTITKKTGGASKAQMKSAQDQYAFATPSNLRDYPGAAKYVGFVNGTTGVLTTFFSSAGSMASARTGVGTYTISGLALSTAGAPFVQSTDADRVASVNTVTGNGFGVVIRAPGGANADISFYFEVYGDLL